MEERERGRKPASEGERGGERGSEGGSERGSEGASEGAREGELRTPRPKAAAMPYVVPMKRLRRKLATQMKNSCRLME